ncbi:GNAT family N-acetyltransferase [Lentilactobacillus senioris]|uniref:GNAT family N-acetyltransferase n=1 Tax=Lentilactobacillus senioris TaxID=931534 RepID=UPI0022823B39|nr:GNAT family N-acetyltransferase [Lentilactobacillus senioris]MCY9807389.1 GNAT family N-acetyltransferase [Lentilactobacillus senioris]
MWSQKKFLELTSSDFYDIIKLRTDIFVVEQKRIYHEVDEEDKKAVHLYYRDDVTGQLWAYARIFREDDGQLTFGRVVTAPAARGKGLGNQLLDHILAYCQAKCPGETIKIEAQQQVVGFYEKHGFVAQGEPFIFNNTPHVLMTYTKKG